MCGLIGRISESQSAEDLFKSLPWLRRRGPDSQRLWSSVDRRVSLLHARLAIVDKDPRAQQPLSNIESGVTVAFVGEIYNYIELREQFPHYRFKTDSDTEVIISTYVTHGIAGLNLLKGMFSLAIVDEKQKRIILVRDPIGKKPLFFACWGKDVLFGTSLLSLVAAYKGGVELNKDTPEHFWQNSYIPSQTTVLSGAVPVLPGQILEFDWSGNILSKSSCKPKALRIYEGESLAKVNENIHFLLSLAVKRRLANNPNPIVLLSGGIDSTVITSIAKKLCEQDNSLLSLKALSLASLIPLMNDEFYARYAAHRIKTPLKVVNPTRDRLADAVTRALALQDEPLGMPSFFLLERLVRAMCSYGRILLSGDGGDEVFLGYGKPADWYTGRDVSKTNSQQLTYGPEIPPWMSNYGRQTVTEVLVGHMLAKVDRASAEQGVEIRCPLLDWDLVSYARSLPFNILTHSGRTKALLKDILQGWPHWFLERPKVGFAYNLRWLWGISCYSGLREAIDRRAIDTFQSYLPKVLSHRPDNWKTRDIFQHFSAVWRLLAWSSFLIRLNNA